MKRMKIAINSARCVSHCFDIITQRVKPCYKKKKRKIYRERERGGGGGEEKNVPQQIVRPFKNFLFAFLALSRLICRWQSARV